MTCQGTHLITCIYLVFFRGPEREETPKHLTNFNHCMMTINSRGLAGGRGGVFRTAVGMNSIYCSYFLEQFHIGFHDRFLARIHMYHHVLAYYIHIKPHIEHQWMLIRTRAWKKFETILKIAANQTAIKQTTTTTYRHIAHWNCTQTNRTQITFVQHLKKTLPRIEWLNLCVWVSLHINICQVQSLKYWKYGKWN